MCSTCDYLISEIVTMRNELSSMRCGKKPPPKRADYWREYYLRHRERKNEAMKARYHAKKQQPTGWDKYKQLRDEAQRDG